MKGFIDDFGKDRPACVHCKHKNKLTVEAPCYDCISILDLALHKPNYETEFASFEQESEGGAETMSKQRLIDADALGKAFFFDDVGTPDERWKPTSEFKAYVDAMPTIDAVPVKELTKLRDCLYENDAITISGLADLNKLISRFTRRCENDYV